ncbi:MAG: LysR family transcriptional regulator [Rhodospirillales bacterium]|nr:LysR family transcriptional regulator [Rhodospirillales bacterium]
MSADWDDLRVFLTLSREGNLSAAAKRLGVSHPTVARRVRALEGRLGARLFDRLPDRFAPTAAGAELLEDAEAMERAAESIGRRSAGLTDTARGVVRISAGEAMTTLLARRAAALRRKLPEIEFELATSHMLANLSRREADLMIREQVPDLGEIVARRIGRVAYAVYGHPNLTAHARPAPHALRIMPWAGFDDAHGYMPGARWLADLLGDVRPAVRANNWLVLQEAARAGAGLAVLPCFLGDSDADLRRVGGVIDAVAADQWLLVHRDLRDLPRVRAVMDAVIELFTESRGALEGRMPRKRRPPGDEPCPASAHGQSSA